MVYVNSTGKLRNGDRKSEGDDALKTEKQNKRGIKSGTDLKLCLRYKTFYVTPQAISCVNCDIKRDKSLICSYYQMFYTASCKLMKY